MAWQAAVRGNLWGKQKQAANRPSRRAGDGGRTTCRRRPGNAIRASPERPRRCSRFASTTPTL